MAGRRNRSLPVLCAGLYSSGSTWLFNVVAELYRSAWRGEGRTLTPLYADSVADFPELAALPDALVIKTHRPDKSLRLLCRIAGGPVLMTLREPRDAIASLTTRFKVAFETQIGGFAASAERMVELSTEAEPLILRYEDRFYDDPATVARIASFLGLQVSADEIARIFLSFTSENVKLKIEELERQGAFGPDVMPTAFEPDTQWHPGHVGDLEIGKYARILSPDQEAQVLGATHRYRQVFGYEIGSNFVSPAIDYTIGETIRFCGGSDAARFLSSGWSGIEPEFVWSLGETSEIALGVAPLPRDIAAFRLRLEVAPFIAGGPPRLSVAVNGRPLFDEHVAGRGIIEIDVPRDLVERQQPTTIALRHPDAARPSEYIAGSRDTRVISVAMFSLQIEAVSSLSATTGSAAPSQAVASD